MLIAVIELHVVMEAVQAWKKPNWLNKGQFGHYTEKYSLKLAKDCIRSQTKNNFCQKTNQK